MKIKFLITGVAWKPLGGLKMIYEYANRLAAEGHDVQIYYGCNVLIGSQSLKAKAKRVLKYLYFRITGNRYKCASWFKLSDNVKEHLVWNLTNSSVGDADHYLSTTLGSSYWLARFPKENKAEWYYFVQGFENWGKCITDKTVYDSYLFHMKKIAVAKWLKRRIETVDKSVEVVFNGFDFSQFYLKRAIETRMPTKVIMMYNVAVTKGCADCFEALSRVKETIPALEVNVFGVPERPDFLPDWYHYKQCPSKQELLDLYNDSAIYVGASHMEGWGLTIGEAMACGCAVACTDNDGYLEMAIDGQTALVSPIKNSQALADNIMKLISNDNFRIEIASRGHEYIQKFDINKTYIEFKKAIDIR